MQVGSGEDLEDIREAGQTVLEATAGRTLDDYLRDKLLRLAVEVPQHPHPWLQPLEARPRVERRRALSADPAYRSRGAACRAASRHGSPLTGSAPRLTP